MYKRPSLPKTKIVKRDPLCLNFSEQKLVQFDEIYKGIVADSNSNEIGAIDLSNNNLQRLFTREFIQSYESGMPTLPAVTHLNLLGNQDLTIKEVV